jgi:hypothetical protein
MAGCRMRRLLAQPLHPAPEKGSVSRALVLIAGRESMLGWRNTCGGSPSFEVNDDDPTR